MRNIRKRNEPHCLAQHRCQTHADYDNFTQKQQLRECLVAEQGGICAYCMQRIRAEVGFIKIEHWHCKDNYPADQLAYGNLLGVCMGGEGSSEKNQHCDTHKGNVDITMNPANAGHDVERVIHYLGSGKIKSDDASLDRELNEALNLNHSTLVNNRKAVLDNFIKIIGRTGGSLKAPIIERKINEWYSPAGVDLEPYCMVVVYWLRKKLARIKRDEKNYGVRL